MSAKWKMTSPTHESILIKSLPTIYIKTTKDKPVRIRLCGFCFTKSEFKIIAICVVKTIIVIIKNPLKLASGNGPNPDTDQYRGGFHKSVKIAVPLQSPHDIMEIASNDFESKPGVTFNEKSIT